MKYRLLISVLLLAAFACQAQNTIDKQGRRQGHWVKTDKQGAKVYEGDFVDGLETGTFTYYYADGKVRIRNTYSVPGKVCQHEVFDAKGNRLAAGGYNQKNRDGKWEFYTEEGKLIKMTHYRMGVKEGLEVLFTSEGDTAEVCTWADNHRNGRWWKRLGSKAYITATYVRGRIEGRLAEFDDNLKPAREATYTNGEMNGHNKYYEDGALTIDETWVTGVRTDRRIRLLLPEERFVSIYDINYLVAQGKQKVIVYMASGDKLTDYETSDAVFAHVGDGRFSFANKEARIMVATDLIDGTTEDNEGREILLLDPKPDFVVYPDEDCMRLIKSLRYQRATEEEGGFDFEKAAASEK